MAQLNLQVSAALSPPEPVITTRRAGDADDDSFRDHLQSGSAEYNATNRPESAHRQQTQSRRQDDSPTYQREPAAADSNQESSATADRDAPVSDDASPAESQQDSPSDNQQDPPSTDGDSEATEATADEPGAQDEAPVTDEANPQENDAEQSATEEEDAAEAAIALQGASQGKPDLLDGTAETDAVKKPDPGTIAQAAGTAKQPGSEQQSGGVPAGADSEAAESTQSTAGNQGGSEGPAEEDGTETQTGTSETHARKEGKKSPPQDKSPLHGGKSTEGQGKDADRPGAAVVHEAASGSPARDALRAAGKPAHAASAPSATPSETAQAPTSTPQTSTPAAATSTSTGAGAAATPATTNTTPTDNAPASTAKAKSAGAVSGTEGGKQAVDGAERRTPAGDTRTTQGSRSPNSGQSLNQAGRVRFVQRVARAFHVAGERGGEVRLRLSPPELGSLRLQVSVRDGMMTARIEVETPAAQAALMDNLPQLRQRLADQDVRIQQFDVHLTGEDSGGTRGAFEDSPQGSEERGERRPARNRESSEGTPQSTSTGPRRLDEPRELNVLV